MLSKQEWKYLAAVLSFFLPLLQMAQIIDERIERRQLQQRRVYYVCPRCGSVWVWEDHLFDPR